jgi:EAL domain-containing protein (putative c-di-GMP-specific phosphodiesterase class I)
LESTSVTAVHEWASRIREALETDAFVLHAQPVVSLGGGTDQFELLVRLPTTDGALLPPGDFLPIAERFGLMPEVDEWVTRRAIQSIAAHAATGRPIRLEVNIGQSTLGSEDFVSMVERELQTSGIDPAALVFEVNGATASSNLDDVAVFSMRLRNLGCLFALDGFGRNAGALEQLKVLPLDFVKIDGSFVRHLSSNMTDQLIVHGLSDLAHALGLRVIAMSVSDEESRVLLEGFDVDFVQGFHVGRPQPLVELR